MTEFEFYKKETIRLRGKERVYDGGDWDELKRKRVVLDVFKVCVSEGSDNISYRCTLSTHALKFIQSLN